ncbi:MULTISPECIES: NAD(P)-dependent oxidoreductase [Sphingobium]|uniref:Nucleoside-diphosphate-sugar epimerase n=1 Tax=Sphingobium fuliginis (strain ATCC 27551) TaxID=336203 RepID=A0A292ZBJ3_SPHSA|nr:MULTISPECIES: NAD(P)-dependent oxidoreductase [Sphingobium]PNP97343.1 NAD(P)-dependent oxidoreductase [Sphingobium sp. SA916]GAY20214.1 nucleoside-diphosphate-sugar epimerase [Sphingobium fuliginis]
MPHMLILGQGYTASRLAVRLREEGWHVTGVRRTADAEALAFDDEDAVRAAIAQASHILSSVPPEGDADPVLSRYGAAIAAAPAIWTGYLSSTGVYGDAAGAWVDEATPLRQGRRAARAQADADWGALRPDVRRFRLPGIYGPGRSVLDRVREGRAHRIDLPDQVFSRAHVDDIGAGIVASIHRGPPGIYNLSDDLPCAQNRLIEAACALLGQPLPPLLTLEEAQLTPMARSFYAENRRIANGRAKRLLGWSPRYPTYRQGLRACL